MRRTQSTGFTLIELLVVIAIIALLIGILMPALAGVRNAAKGAKTSAMLESINNGIQSSKLDNGGALPGLFSQADLGTIENGKLGLTAMENILLDLAAGDGLIGRRDLVEDRPQDFGSPDTGLLIKVGVDGTDKTKQYYVNPSLFGAGSPVVELDKGDLAHMSNGGSSQTGQIGQHGDTSTVLNAGTIDEPERSMPDLIDAFGQPVLAWVKDDYGPSTISDYSYDDALDDFVRFDSDDDPAWFYLNSNAGYLATDAFGKKLNPQFTDDADSALGSKLGTQTAGQADFHVDVRDAFMALYGNTAYADDPNKTAKQEIFAMHALGDVMLQSGGPDGVFFRNGDKGSNASVNDEFKFGAAFVGTGDPRSIAKAFDDILN